jgi:hypothetical protein
MIDTIVSERRRPALTRIAANALHRHAKRDNEMCWEEYFTAAP